MEWYRDSTEGRRPSSQRANQIAQELGYDDAHQLKGENGNVTTKNNTLDSAYSQTFTYDPLNRLSSSTLGGAAYQSRTLDSQGNWSSYTSNGTTQTQTANAQNQITSISGSTAPTYDANGNMTSGSLTTQPAASVTMVYDAWNRLVSVSNASGQVIAQYTYNAMGYRITETYPQGGNGIVAGTVNNIYYDSSWQAIETRTDGTASSNVTSQTVWSAAYINAVVLQDTYSAGVIQPNSRLYFLQDANWNTTAIVGLVSGSWQITQRYVYSPYGTITVLTSDWSTTGETPLVSNLYQGMTLDPVTGLCYARNRNYSPSLCRWINQDPAGFINGANTYQFVMSNPVGNVDPWGLAGNAQPIYLPPVGGYTETNFNNQGTITAIYPGGETQSSYQLTPVGPVPLGPAYVPSVSDLLLIGGFSTNGWENAIARGTVGGFATGFLIGSFGGPEGAVLGGLRGEFRGLIGGLIGYPVEKFVLGFERYFFGDGHSGPPRPSCKDTFPSPVNPYMPYGGSGPTYVPNGPSLGLW